MTPSSQAWKPPKSPSAGAPSLISHLQPGQKIVPARLRKALTVPEAREGAVGPRPAETRRRHTALEQSPDQKDTIRTLRKDITRLNNEVVRRDKRILQLNKRLDREKQSTETIRETARKLSSESLRLHREVRILGHSEARARSLSDEVF